MTLKRSLLSFLSPQQWTKETFELMWPSEIFATVTISPLGQPILVSTGGEIWRLCRLTNCGQPVPMRQVRRVRLEIAAEYLARVRDLSRLEKLLVRCPQARDHLLGLKDFGLQPPGLLVNAQDFVRTVVARLAAREAVNEII